MTAPLRIGLDRSSPVPLYFQLTRAIEEAIERGEYSSGSRLENELDMARRLRVSRPTVRRAIQELVTKGLVVRRRGIGTQVVSGRVNRPVKLTSPLRRPGRIRPCALDARRGLR